MESIIIIIFSIVLANSSIGRKAHAVKHFHTEIKEPMECCHWCDTEIEQDLQKDKMNTKSPAKNKEIKRNFAEVEADGNAKREKAVEVMNSAILNPLELKHFAGFS